MTVRLNVNISEALNSRLDVLASQSGITKSELIRKAIALIDLAVTEKGQGHHLGILSKDRTVLREIVGI